MNTVEAEKRLKEYLLEGIGTQIAIADYTYALAEEISKHHKQINEANFGELFGLLQQILSDRQTLEATKLVDPKRRHDIRSIPGTLALLESHAQLWRIPERWKLNEAYEVSSTILAQASERRWARKEKSPPSSSYRRHRTTERR